jgi:hypothetical protein
MIPSQQAISAWRDLKYHRRPNLRVRAEEDAEAFINEVGLCLLFPSADVELPSLWEAICGEARPLPETHDSYELGLAWEWKDTLPARRAAIYGKFVRRKPVFVSRTLFPNLYALSGNYGEADDYMERYKDGVLSEAAKRVCDALMEGGALATGELRKRAQMDGGRHGSLFTRALTELQMALLVTKGGISEEGSFGYAYVYDLIPRLYPDLVAAARSITENQAADVLLLTVLRANLVAPPLALSRLFGWEPWRLDRSAQRLARQGRIVTNSSVEGLDERWLALSESEQAQEVEARQASALEG